MHIRSKEKLKILLFLKPLRMAINLFFLLQFFLHLLPLFLIKGFSFLSMYLNDVDKCLDKQMTAAISLTRMTTFIYLKLTIQQTNDGSITFG